MANKIKRGILYDDYVLWKGHKFPFIDKRTEGEVALFFLAANTQDSALCKFKTVPVFIGVDEKRGKAKYQLKAEIV